MPSNIVMLRKHTILYLGVVLIASMLLITFWPVNCGEMLRHNEGLYVVFSTRKDPVGFTTADWRLEADDPAVRQVVSAVEKYTCHRTWKTQKDNQTSMGTGERWMYVYDGDTGECLLRCLGGGNVVSREQVYSLYGGDSAQLVEDVYQVWINSGVEGTSAQQ